MKKEAVFLNNTYLCGHEIFFNLSEIKEEYPLHFHEFYELELLIEGEGYEIINGIKYDIKPNTLFLFHPTDYHQIIATKPLKIFNVAFTDSIIDEKNIINFLDYDNGIVINLSENKLKQVRSTIEIIRDIFYGNRSNKELILTHLVNALLLIIIGSHELKNNTITTKKNVDVLKYIQNNFQKNPSLEELSQFDIM